MELQITVSFADIYSMEGEAEGIVGTVQKIKTEPLGPAVHTW